MAPDERELHPGCEWPAVTGCALPSQAGQGKVERPSQDIHAGEARHEPLGANADEGNHDLDIVATR